MNEGEGEGERWGERNGDGGGGETKRNLTVWTLSPDSQDAVSAGLPARGTRDVHKVILDTELVAKGLTSELSRQVHLAALPVVTSPPMLPPSLAENV